MSLVLIQGNNSLCVTLEDLNINEIQFGDCLPAFLTINRGLPESTLNIGAPPACEKDRQTIHSTLAS